MISRTETASTPVLSENCQKISPVIHPAGLPAKNVRQFKVPLK
jgi:hypothetical protein